MLCRLFRGGLPLFAVVCAHHGSSSLWSMIMHYPGQFLWGLAVFPVASYFVWRATHVLEEALNTDGELQARWYPALRGRRLLGVTLVLGALLAATSYFFDPHDIYTFDAETADRITGHYDGAIDGLRSIRDPEKRSRAVEYVQLQLAGATAPPPFDPAKLDRVVDDARNVLETLRSNRRRLPLIVGAEAIELTATAGTDFHLFFLCVVLIRLKSINRFGRKIRLGAVYAAVALVLLAVWIPCRLFSMSELKMLDPEHAMLGGPYIAFAVVATCAVFVYLVFAKNGPAVEYVKGALPLIPIAASGVAMFTDPIEWAALRCPPVISSCAS